MATKKIINHDDFLSLLSAPARRALEGKGITTPATLSTFTEKEVLALHGIGKSSIPVLTQALAKNGLTLKKG